MGGGHHHEHGHSHGTVDASISENREATRVLLISLAGLLATAIIQAVIVALSGSVALLADTIHNFGDALTSIPLWVAFMLSRRPPTRRFTYGLQRSEDLAGLIIVLVIAVSAVVAGYESVQRLFHGAVMDHLGAVAVAAVVGFLGNEVVALYRIAMGKKMGSAALVADGQHARVDGITSLAVLVGVAGTWLGYPVVDPIVGLVITGMILMIVKDSASAVFTRILDGVDPGTVEDIAASAAQVAGVLQVSDVRARWLGHRLLAEVSVTVSPDLSVAEGHGIALRVMHQLQHDVDHVAEVLVHVDPSGQAGQAFHTHHAHHADHPA